MKNLLASILLVSYFGTAYADVYSKTVTVRCSPAKDIGEMLSSFGEQPLIASVHSEDTTILTVYGNLETGTTTWVAYVPNYKEYCVFGAGDTIIFPSNSKTKKIKSEKKNM